MKRKVLVFKKKEKAIKVVAEIISIEIGKKPNLVLGLATGKTMIPLYKNLVKLYESGNIDFSKVRTFNLDEYYGLSLENTKSLRSYMEKYLFTKVNLAPKNIYFLNGNLKNYENTCKIYEKEIKKSGGIDLQILGLGINGHIGFNEPGSSFKSKTRLIELDKISRKSISNFNKPKKALTMGIGTIMNARKIVLMAFGRKKKKAVKEIFITPTSVQRPASALVKHSNTIFVFDNFSK